MDISQRFSTTGSSKTWTITAIEKDSKTSIKETESAVKPYHVAKKGTTRNS